MDLPTIVSIVAALAAVGSVIYAKAEVAKIKSQLEQTSGHNLTEMSNQLNWDLFDRREHLPPVLPCWVGLDDMGWAWRVVLLNHLNLLKLARQDHTGGLMSDRELEGWELKARYWFRSLWAQDADPEVQAGRDALRQLLRPEEGYPKEFRKWLVESHIVPPDLVSD
jgi:hypothetical protein